MQLFWHHVLKTCLLFYESNNFVVNHIVKYVGIFCRLYFFLTCFISSCTNTTILKVTVVVVLASQLCLILCDLTDCSPSGSSVHGILKARILEWVAISFSRVMDMSLSKTPGDSEGQGSPWIHKKSSTTE